MKKYFKYGMMALALGFGFSFTSCDVETDEEPGGTAVQNLAGHWEVYVDVVDEDGNTLAEDIMGGAFDLYTYNTAANNPDSLWITDNGNFWQFTMKVGCDNNALTFSCPEKDYDEVGTGKAIVSNGKVLLGKAVNLHGMPNDSIVFDITFSDDEPAHGTIYRITGQKYTGFYE